MLHQKQFGDIKAYSSAAGKVRMPRLSNAWHNPSRLSGIDSCNRQAAPPSFAHSPLRSNITARVAAPQQPLVLERRTTDPGGHDLNEKDLTSREGPESISGAENDCEDGKYDWTKAWYPVALESDLPADRPTSVRLLGNAIVLWKDGEGKWRAFQDMCPHRLAPLSEGRVENGELMCSYHGWQFRGSDGRATHIPQADTEQREQTAVASPRSCCAVHPCEIHEKMVWVYGSNKAGAAEESQGVRKASLPKLADPDFTQITPWFVRDLPYGADVLCENVIDPAHVPYSHHGLQGNRFKIPKMVMKPAESISAEEGFRVHTHQPLPPQESELDPQDEKAQGGKRASYDISFTPPTLIRYHYQTQSELVTHAVPTDPGRSRVFFTFILPKSRLKGLFGLIVKLKTSKWLLWSDHLTRNSVLDGDSVFLALQDQEIQRRNPTEFSQLYFMPASLDYGVVGIRQWFKRYAKAVPWGAGALPPGSGQSRREMLDRFGQHTVHCPSCAGAHKVFSKSRWVGALAATFAAAYLAFAAGNGAPLRKLLVPGLGVLFSALLAAKSQDWKEKLEFQDYRHPEH